ncbi:MAG: hypothetical protein EFT35_08165 [Methanophagales archaeon ANME-1-THS]|nr:MAG: hypothetical protein EFT35_08165 [Methanophagales archaeon ANME-1-THS]
MTPLTVFLVVVLGACLFLIAFLSLKLHALELIFEFSKNNKRVIFSVKLHAIESGLEMLHSREGFTDKEIEQMESDVEWLKEMKNAGKLY